MMQRDAHRAEETLRAASYEIGKRISTAMGTTMRLISPPLSFM